MARIFSVRINLDAFFASVGVCDTDQDRSVWLQGFQIGALGGEFNQDWSRYKLAGFKIGNEAHLAALGFSAKQAEKGRASAVARSTAVQPSLNRGSTAVQPSLNQTSTISNNPVNQESEEPEIQESIDPPPQPSKRGRKTSTTPVRDNPPSLEDVTKYCDERASIGKPRIDPEDFLAYYMKRGWRMKDGTDVFNWKACVWTFEKTAKTPRKNDVAPDYSAAEDAGYTPSAIIDHDYTELCRIWTVEDNRLKALGMPGNPEPYPA